MLVMASLASVTGPHYGPLGPAVEAMWELPERMQPTSVLFLAHGCNHQGTDFWWFASPDSSKSCLGLPEEVRIAKAALKAGLAVVAVTSTDRMSGCWNFEVDGPIVRDALAAFKAKAQLVASLPVVAFGASSGGAFVLQLPALMPGLKAVVSQIMAIPPAMLPSPMPPTLFVHMARDGRTTSMVHKCVRKLKQSGGVAHQIEVPPKKISAEFFSERIERLAPATATQLHSAIKAGGLLDGDGMLLEDPRRSPWREALEKVPGLLAALPGPRAEGPPDSLRPDQSALAEVLNVAWAAHEIMSDPMAQTLEWLSQLGPRGPPKGAGELRAA
jgi:hypothetical protein